MVKYFFYRFSAKYDVEVAADDLVLLFELKHKQIRHF